ncbi:protein translocase subunit SecD [Agrilutibacter solisilvae]|uniref:Protein translocase subunit SecD n=1 Tax=Agrilutibacter solisilvae TaxID=2763317 RepID=A0A974XWM5_9GAMM|nr:protein translocase subunit SecD [Lysobacter solisilvae]QSX77192.1 protein translocase subunit SecD [Lysobacter solisilvae]
MLTYARWKYAVFLVVLLISALYALPNAFPQDPSIQVTATRGAPVDEALRKRVTDSLKTAGVPLKQAELVPQKNSLVVRLPNADVQVKAADTLRAQLGNDYVVALFLSTDVPDWLETIRAKPMFLGLDLQGGVHFLMQVDRAAALDKRVDGLADDIRTLLRDNEVVYDSVDRRPDNSIVANLRNPADAEKARQLIARSQPTLPLEVSGNTIVARIPQVQLDAMAVDAVEQNVTTLRNRVNQLGVAEPIVQRQGSDRVVVELPGVQDPGEAKRMIGATATLEYRAVVEGNAYDAIASGSIPAQARVYYRRELGPDGKRIPVLLNKRLIASGDQVEDAQPISDQQTGLPAVSVRLNSAGGQRMFDFTSENVDKPMAVVFIERLPETRIVDGKEVRSFRVDEQVISVANVNEPFGRQFQTTGLSRQEANDLSKLLKAGSLAAPMDFIEESVVGPSLGAENVERGLRAVLYSFSFALIFFLFYYRVFGLITCIALMLNLLMVVAVMSMFGATLSLPGLAGIALTVGMSVDANVLINERIREELRMGLPPQTAISEGYKHAAGTIADANLTAILAGVALYAFGTGPVKGFAVALIVGILTSMYTAVSVSRGLATLIYGGRRKVQTLWI